MLCEVAGALALYEDGPLAKATVGSGQARKLGLGMSLQWAWGIRGAYVWFMQSVLQFFSLCFSLFSFRFSEKR